MDLKLEYLKASAKAGWLVVTRDALSAVESIDHLEVLQVVL
jgi:hypothetical protein